MPYTHANQPTADDPSAATNTASVPDPNTGGDLAAAIALLAQTLAAKNVCPQPTPNTPAILVDMLTRIQEPNTFNGLDVNKLQLFNLQCRLHFQDYANAFSSDRAKVAYALSFLMGPALSWFEI